MIVTLTARRLRPGTYEEFRAAWEPAAPPAGWTQVEHCRDVADADAVLLDGSFAVVEALTPAAA